LQVLLFFFFSLMVAAWGMVRQVVGGGQRWL